MADFEKELAALGAESEQPAAEERPPADPLGIAAIVVGCLGILVAGILLCVVTGVLAAEAGRKARAEGRSMENAYIAFVLAAVDGVVWIALHVIFDLHFVYG